MKQPAPEAHIQVQDLTIKYGERLIQQHLNFEVRRQDVFVIMGGSGCGKSTLLKHMIGLYKPAAGRILINGESLWEVGQTRRRQMMRQFGVSYQAGALVSSLTLAQNIGMPLELYTKLTQSEIRECAELKLAMVGLAGFGDYYPSEISGGMLKRAALARAIALDPEILFFDEPSAGLDPVSANLLDELILELNASMKSTVVMVTHELASIFHIANNSIFLDSETKTQLATGAPENLLQNCKIDTVQRFLRRGKTQ